MHVHGPCFRFWEWDADADTRVIGLCYCESVWIDADLFTTTGAANPNITVFARYSMGHSILYDPAVAWWFFRQCSGYQLHPAIGTITTRP